MRGRTSVVWVRLPKPVADKARELAKRDFTTISDILRRQIVAGLRARADV
ncbi:MAG TPA: hypothetical protein VLT86_13000 [Vicinamibacterales bacterium]|nr:hypothetical protein [Vicinamibacterales bacterium]